MIERSAGETVEPGNAAESSQHTPATETGESADGESPRPERRGAQTPRESATEHTGEHSELTPLGIDIEAAPFVALAAIAILAGVVAALHILGAVLAAVMVREARRTDPARPGAAAQSRA